MTTAALPKIQTVSKLSTGALRVHGLAANWSGYDRQGENFVKGAFSSGAFASGVDRAMNRASGLGFHYHHRHDLPLGRVEALWETDEGLMMDAVVDYAEPGSPARFAYSGILSGSIRGLSVGGIFRRDGGMIVGVDLTEVSATPVAVHDGTWLRVVEVGADPSADALAAAKLAELRAEVFLMQAR
ncbi:hypothetical protein [Patulibacter sp.]|uniref:hypothetical protein n=1 Tax=Patulibacter sp. TaxID=1912859 RepID=UPI00271E43FD|nr:hypothetical protein [Patulibacter sp.]MDO9409708.1 hypothetical protein [Patulibacter sp.]